VRTSGPEGEFCPKQFRKLYGNCRQSALDALTSSRRIITTISSQRSYTDVRHSILRDSIEMAGCRQKQFSGNCKVIKPVRFVHRLIGSHIGCNRLYSKAVLRRYPFANINSTEKDWRPGHHLSTVNSMAPFSSLPWGLLTNKFHSRTRIFQHRL
jgi:hypothetical protein